MKTIGLIVLLLATTMLTPARKNLQAAGTAHRTDKSATKLFEPQREALDKAKGVGKTVEQASQEREESAEKAPATKRQTALAWKG